MQRAGTICCARARVSVTSSWRHACLRSVVAPRYVVDIKCTCTSTLRWYVHSRRTVSRTKHSMGASAVLAIISGIH